jgi:arginyl-tRNA synthetase
MLAYCVHPPLQINSITLVCACSQVEEKPESYYRTRVPGVLQELEEKQFLTHEENHALLVDRSEWESPLVLRKQDGSYTYASTDVATIKYRLHEQHAQWLIYVTDASQRNHFSKVGKRVILIRWCVLIVICWCSPCEMHWCSRRVLFTYWL